MAEIVWTLEVSRCLDEIYDYIASDSPASAHKVVVGIYEKVQILRQHVRIGQRYERIADREVREISTVATSADRYDAVSSSSVNEIWKTWVEGSNLHRRAKAIGLA